LKATKNLFHIDRLIDHLIGFVETRFEIFKLEAKEESVRVIARLITMAVIVLFGTLFFIFFSFALAIFLNQVTGSPYMGFAIIAAFFLLLWIIVLGIKRTKWYQDQITAITDRIVEDSNENPDERDRKVTGSSQ
jgi:uncharacterized membrane protein YqjE